MAESRREEEENEGERTSQASGMVVYQALIYLQSAYFRKRLNLGSSVNTCNIDEIMCVETQCEQQIMWKIFIVKRGTMLHS